MITIMNNIDFEITNITMTNNSIPISYGGQLTPYSNIHDTSIEMTAITHISNIELLKDWLQKSQNGGCSSSYKIDTFYNGMILNGVILSSFDYNFRSNYINSTFLVDYTYYDDELMMKLKRQQEIKERKNKLIKLDKICKEDNN